MRRQTYSDTGVLLDRRTSHPHTEEDNELPQLIHRDTHSEGVSWTRHNPAIRQLTSSFRSAPTPKHYPLGLWVHQKDKKFPVVHDTCVISAEIGQRSRKLSGSSQRSNSAGSNYESRSLSECTGSSRDTPASKETSVLVEHTSNFPPLSAPKGPSYVYRQHAGPSTIKKRDRLINNYMEDRPNDCSIASHPKRDDGSDKPVTTYTPPWELYGEKSFIEKNPGKSKKLIQVTAHADSRHNQCTDDVENECPNLRRLGRHGPINSVNHQKVDDCANDPDPLTHDDVPPQSAYIDNVKISKKKQKQTSTKSVDTIQRKNLPPLLRRKHVQFTDEVLADIPTDEVLADIPTDDVLADIPIDEVLADIPTDEVLADIPTDEVLADIPTEDKKNHRIEVSTYGIADNTEGGTQDVDDGDESEQGDISTEGGDVAECDQIEDYADYVVGEILCDVTMTLYNIIQSDERRSQYDTNERTGDPEHSNTIIQSSPQEDDCDKEVLEDETIERTISQDDIPTPPIYIIRVCMSIESGVSSQHKAVLHEVIIPQCKDWLRREGYYLDLMTFDIDQMADMDSSTITHVTDIYLTQCKRHGLGPFHYMIQGTNRDEDLKHMQNDKIDVDHVLKAVDDAAIYPQDPEFKIVSRKCLMEDLIDSEGQIVSTNKNADNHISTGTSTSLEDQASNDFMDFIRAALSNIKIINDRREQVSGLSLVDAAEIWSHYTHTSCEQSHDLEDGSTELVDKIKELLHNTAKNQPIVVQYDETNTNSRLLEYLATMIPTWMSSRPVMVRRYSCNTCRSSRLESLLEGICREICWRYDICDTDIIRSRDSVQSTKSFMALMDMVSHQYGVERPLVILMDNVDTLDNGCHWIPHTLPPHVSMIVTISKNSTECVHNLLKGTHSFQHMLTMKDTASGSDRGSQGSFSKALVEAENVMKQPDLVGHVACILMVQHDGISVEDITNALLCDDSLEEDIRNTKPHTLKFFVHCILSFLSPWLHVTYDSGELFFGLPKALHPIIIDTYVILSGDPREGLDINHCRESVLKAHIGRPTLRADYDNTKEAVECGMVILTQTHISYFCKRLASNSLSSNTRSDIIKKTLFNFSWIGYKIHILSAETTRTVLWQLRLHHQSLGILCEILDSQFCQATDVNNMASYLVSCIDAATDDDMLFELHKTAKDWLLCATPMSMIPCSPTIVNQHFKHSQIAGPGTILCALDDNRILVWGQEYGLQIWNVVTSLCCSQLGQPMNEHDIVINKAKQAVYHTSDTFLIGWSLTNGKQVTKFDLLPQISRERGLFDTDKYPTPFLNMADVSHDGEMIAVRINHEDMLINNKGIIIVSFVDGCVDIGTVGLNLYGTSLTNIRFNECGNKLVITQRLEDDEPNSRLFLISTDFSVNDEITEVDHQSGLPSNQNLPRMMPEAGRRMSQASDGGRRMSQLDIITEEEDENKIKLKPSGEQGLRNEQGQYEGDTSEVMLDRNRHNSANDVVEDNNALSDIDISATHLDVDGNIKLERSDSFEMLHGGSGNLSSDQSPRGPGSGMSRASSRAVITRQDAVDIADEKLVTETHPIRRSSLKKIHGNIMIQLKDRIIPATLHTSAEVAVMGCAPNALARFDVAERILKVSDSVSDGLYHMKDLLRLSNQQILTAYTQDLAGRMLMLRYWSPKPYDIFIEHHGTFQFIKVAAQNVIIAYDNKILIMNSDKLTITHAFDFPIGDVKSAYLRNTTLFVGTGHTVLSKDIMQYELSPPSDLASTSSDSLTGEDEEGTENIRIIPAPKENLPACITRYGPMSVSDVVLLRNGNHAAVSVAGRLKLMNIEDGTLHSVKHCNMRLTDLAIIGCDSFLAVGKDHNPSSFTIMKWHLDDLTSDPEVTHSVTGTLCRFSNNKAWMCSVNRCDKTEGYVDVYVTSLLNPSVTRRYTLPIQTGPKKFTISDCGSYMVLWIPGPAVYIWRLETPDHTETQPEQNIHMAQESHTVEPTEASGSHTVDSTHDHVDENEEPNDFEKSLEDPIDQNLESSEDTTNMAAPEDSFDQKLESSKHSCHHLESTTCSTSNCIKLDLSVSANSLAIVDNLLVIGTKQGNLHQFRLNRLFDVKDDPTSLENLIWKNHMKLVGFVPRDVRILYGTTLAIIGKEGVVKLLDISHPEHTVDSDVYTSEVTYVDVSADRTMLLVCYSDGTIRVCCTSTGRMMCTVSTHASVHRALFTQQDQTVLVWLDANGGQRSRLMKYQLHRR